MALPSLVAPIQKTGSRSVSISRVKPPRSTMQRRTRSSDVGRVWSAAKRIAGARLQPRMATIALISAHLLAERPQTELGPVGLRLQSSSCLGTDFRVDDLRRSDQTEMQLEARIAAVVPQLLAQLSVHVGATDVRPDDQCALDSDQLRFP